MTTSNLKLKGLRASLLSCATALPLLGMATIAHATNCEGSNFNSPAPADTAGVVRLFAEDVPDTDYVVALLDAFHEAYPNITVEIESGAFDVIRDQQISSFQRSEGTQNVMQIIPEWVAEYDEAGFVEDLAPAIACLGAEYDYEDFSESFRVASTIGDKVISVPFYSYPTGFVYRTDLWDKAPETLDELVEGAIARHSDDVAGLALQQKQGYVIMEEWNAWLLGAGGQLRQADGTWTIDTDEARVALNAYIRVSKNAAPEASLNWGFDETIRAASSGQASALTSYAWVVSMVNGEHEFKLAPFPGGRGTAGNWSWAIPTNAPNKDAAWAFISFITSPEQDKLRTIPGGAPVRTSVMNDPEVWAGALPEDYYKAFSEVASNAVAMCLGVGCAEAIEAVGVEINAAVAGLKSVDEALADAQRAAERATR